MELVLRMAKSLAYSVVFTIMFVFACSVILWVVNNGYIFTAGPIAFLAVTWRVVYNILYRKGTLLQSK